MILAVSFHQCTCMYTHVTYGYDYTDVYKCMYFNSTKIKEKSGQMSIYPVQQYNNTASSYYFNFFTLDLQFYIYIEHEKVR